jgi:hypothetical protein
MDLTPDWILKETFAVQDTSAQWFKEQQSKMASSTTAETASKKEDGNGLTMTVIGCGTSV